MWSQMILLGKTGDWGGMVNDITASKLRKIVYVFESLNAQRKKKTIKICFFSFDSFCFAELSPVCAIVGGVIGQEIIKVITPYVSVLLLHGRNRKIKQKVNLIHDLIWI